MIYKFKHGDLVKYRTYNFPTEMWALDMEEHSQLAVITGFYDQETGKKLSEDFNTYDNVVMAEVAGSAGNGRVMMHDLELLSSVETKKC